MRTRYSCRLNGVDISDVDESIILLDVVAQPPVSEIKTTALYGADGQRVGRRNINSMSVEIKFEIHEKDIERRAYVMERVAKWAYGGGELTIRERPGRRLNVVCESFAALDALKWTSAMTIVFTAFEIPYWEDVNPETATVNGDGEATIYAPGFAAAARISATVKNTGESTITAVELTAGETKIKWDGLEIPAGGVLEVGYDDKAVFYAKVDSQSVLGKRTAESSDELRMEAGTRGTLRVATDGKAQTGFKARGYYL